MYFQVYQTKVFRNTFYCSNIRLLLSYATPAWFTLLGDTNLEKLEKEPCSANRIILPNYEYDECLEMLCIPSLAKFLHELRQRDSSNIVSDSSHPLFSRLSFNNCRVSSCNSRWCTLQELKTQGIKISDGVVFSRYSRVKCFANHKSVFLTLTQVAM